MLITSREYKVIVDSSWLVDFDAAKPRILDDIFDDIKDLAQALRLPIEGAFDAAKPKERIIRFLDTPDFTLRQNGLLLRERVDPDKGTTEYTLKRRTEDRYIASDESILEAPVASERKFEEDIGSPFVSRFSHSATIGLDKDHKLGGDHFPTALDQAAALFPGLLTMRRDNQQVTPETTLTPVNGRRVFERVFEGPALRLPARESATVALILWSKASKGRVLTAEFSFRYKDKNEAFAAKVAAAARRFFEGVQGLDWARPGASTKTQYMYGNA